MSFLKIILTIDLSYSKNMVTYNICRDEKLIWMSWKIQASSVAINLSFTWWFRILAISWISEGNGFQDGEPFWRVYSPSRVPCTVRKGLHTHEINHISCASLTIFGKSKSLENKHFKNTLWENNPKWEYTHIYILLKMEKF